MENNMLALPIKTPQKDGKAGFGTDGLNMLKLDMEKIKNLLCYVKATLVMQKEISNGAFLKHFL